MTANESDSPSEEVTQFDEDALDEQIEASYAVPGTDSLLGKSIYLLSIVTALLAIIQVVQLPLTRVRYDNFHLGLALVLFALIEVYRHREATDTTGWSRKSKLKLAGFAGLMLAGAAVTLYIELNFPALQTTYTEYTVLQTALGALLIGVVILAMYWAYGWMITGVAVFALLYARYGTIFPGLLQHSGKAWTELVALNVLQVNSGVFHLLFHIGATWIFIFLIWSGIVEELGGLETFFNIGFIVGNKFRSGVAQTAVIASMIMGSISGSPMANSIVTGSFTIPLMKKRGIDSPKAAAIESVASTGGMVLPPVMGSVAFLMTTFLNVSYGHIIVVAALPAILFYVSVALSVHLITLNLDADIDMKVEETPDARQTLIDFAPILVSLATLVYLLLVMGYSPGIAGVGTMTSLVLAEGGKRLIETRGDPSSLIDVLKHTVAGLRTGTVRMVPISVTLAAIGVLITSFAMTGIGYRLSSAVVAAAGGSIVLLLALVMISSIFLGMGMPTVAAYLLTITLIAPAMTEVGFQTITAHFFVFYYAMLASITPPIALVCAVTCRIANTRFIDVAYESIKLGIPLFLLPWVFAFNESLLVLTGMSTVLTFILTLAGFIALTLGLHGGTRILRGRRHRVTFVAVGFVMIGVPYLLQWGPVTS